MSARKLFSALLIVTFISFPVIPKAQEEAGEDLPQPAWTELSDAERREVFAFGEDYKDFMSRARPSSASLLQCLLDRRQLRSVEQQ